MDEIIKKLNLNLYELVRDQDGRKTFKVTDSNEYGKLFSKIEQSDFEEVETQMTINGTQITYEDTETGTEIRLVADLDEDEYFIYVEEVE